uniref:Uncharacterized protein n=1 Tax=uncultured bacterium contig00036 TaxID=1181524 RepID=A0A806K0E2_9BACT|nr:hypothetical protein [uncultured bacterium contig00036]
MSDNNQEVMQSGQRAGLQINLIKQTYVFPWSQFLFAEGGADEIRMAFSTHDVVISGSKLDTLLADITGQRVSLLREPVRAEFFTSISGGLQITNIFVKKVE